MTKGVVMYRLNPRLFPSQIPVLFCYTHPKSYIKRTFKADITKVDAFTFHAVVSAISFFNLDSITSITSIGVLIQTLSKTIHEKQNFLMWGKQKDCMTGNSEYHAWI